MPNHIDFDLDEELRIDPEQAKRFTSAIHSGSEMRSRLQNPVRQPTKVNTTGEDKALLERNRWDVTKHLLTDRAIMKQTVDSMLVGHYFVVKGADEIYIRNLTYRRTRANDSMYSIKMFKYNKTKYYRVVRMKNKPNSLRIVD